MDFMLFKFKGDHVFGMRKVTCLKNAFPRVALNKRSEALRNKSCQRGKESCEYKENVNQKRKEKW